ncbi:MAG: response regulator transcription factor [Alistipes sp.]|nr:response regulator transcription factor [Alistipes sp.]
MSHRILLVDDEPDILEFIRYNLLKEGYEVYTAPDGARALEAAIRHRPHLILLDRMMPVMDGAETCRAIRRDPRLRETIVVFLSALGEEEQQLTGFGAGADDYLVKPIRMKLLVSRVKAILKRVETEPERRESGLEIDRERYAVRCDGREITLPRKEFALLDLLASAPGKLIPREEIYTRIWGTKVVVGDRTIDVHIRKLRQKIGEDRITTVKGVGYRYEAQ